MAYDNTIPILREQKNEIVEQGLTLDSIDSKLTSQTTGVTQLDQKDLIIHLVSLQEDLLEVSRQILEQIKALRGGEF